jgi:hypothetical protein
MICLPFAGRRRFPHAENTDCPGVRFARLCTPEHRRLLSRAPAMRAVVEFSLDSLDELVARGHISAEFRDALADPDTYALYRLRLRMLQRLADSEWVVVLKE